MTTATATRIKLNAKINIRKAPKKGKTDNVTDVGIFLGDIMVAFRSAAPGNWTERYSLAQFRRTKEQDFWQKNPQGWEMYKAYNKLGVV